MPAFAFTARSAAGRTRKGLRVVASEAALARELAGEGLFLIQASPAARAVPDPAKARLGAKDLAQLLLHLAAYLEVGLSPLAALRDYRNPERPRLEAAVADMAARMAEGASLSRIMAAYPALFQPVHVGMIQAGEASGRLDQALRAVIKLVEWDDGFRVQVRKAATYPLILLVLLGAIVLLVSAFSLPPVLKLLEDLGIPLPTVTRVFLAVGHGLHRYGWLLLAAPSAAWFAVTLALRRPGFRLAWDSALLRLPVAGPLVSRMALARFAHFFAAQVRAGIPMVEALRLSEGATGNARLGLGVRAVRLGVEQGGGLAASAARTGQFPQLVIRMLALGEETGKLEETLEKAAARFDAEAEEGVRMTFQVLDPLIKILMACLLVFVAAAVLMPLYMMIGGLNE